MIEYTGLPHGQLVHIWNTSCIQYTAISTVEQPLLVHVKIADTLDDLSISRYHCLKQTSQNSNQRHFIKQTYCHYCQMAVWHSGHFIGHINEVSLYLAQSQSVLEWVTVFGGHTTSIS